MAESVEDLGWDTGILKPNQLSDDEWRILIEIEQRLSEVKKSVALDSDCGDANRYDAPKEFAPHHVAKAERRRQRALLLDGARGTGKTSFLVTLINRWHCAAALPDTEPWKVDEETKNKLTLKGLALGAAPENVRVIRNLDFDPLPPKMPLVAGIVQAWRPLTEFYDRETFVDDELCENTAGQRLMDSWHSLFRVAAAGWSELPRSKGLIEQVLDREEQVRDWQYFREQWLWFVDAVIRTGVCGKTRARLKDPPVFVIVIDDVDLQVERIRELLPALRLLVHDNVFFLVAAHRLHMIDMLKLDFLGQQQRLAEIRSQDAATLKAVTDKDRWASELAHAAFEKVFPVRNRWRLDQLTLSALLQYPNDGGMPLKSFSDVLDLVISDVSLQSDSNDENAAKTAGKAIHRLAVAAEKAYLTLPALSYRSAQQLWQTVSGMSSDFDKSCERAADVLSRLVSSHIDEPARVLPDKAHTIQIPTIGELAAFYRPGVTSPGGADDVVVSDRPDFLYIAPDGVIASMSAGNTRFDFTAGLVANTLQEIGFPVDAGALRWEARLALAWTDWPSFSATFAWPWHTHPRPDELFERTVRWSEYLRAIRKVAEKKNIRARHAYAWIYYEREMYFKRKGKDPQPTLEVLDPTELAEATEFPWEALLKFLKEEPESDDLKRWKESTLPLLARPELGLPEEGRREEMPTMQDRLLEYVKEAKASVLNNLKDERLRLATDALFVDSVRRGKVPEGPSSDVEELLKKIESRHRDAYDGAPSTWSITVEERVPPPIGSAA